MHDQIYEKMLTTSIRGMSVNDLVGGGDPKQNGESVLAALRADEVIREQDDVLEIGCGCGRAAVPLATYLECGTYTGTDIIPGLVDFCRDEIGSRLTNTAFYLAREANPLYDSLIDPSRADGGPALDPDACFDVVIAFSVFTHLDEPAAGKMLREIYARLRPGGFAVSSWFVLDDFAREQVAAGHANHFRGLFLGEGTTIETIDGALGAVGYDRARLGAMIREAGFQGIYAQHNGFWRSTLGRQYQDVVVLRRDPDLPEGFQWEEYRDANPDVRVTGINPPFHWRAFGRTEGRRLRPG